jgi:hypothetical protein
MVYHGIFAIVLAYRGPSPDIYLSPLTQDLGRHTSRWTRATLRHRAQHAKETDQTRCHIASIQMPPPETPHQTLPSPPLYFKATYSRRKRHHHVTVAQSEGFGFSPGRRAGGGGGRDIDALPCCEQRICLALSSS